MRTNRKLGFVPATYARVAGLGLAAALVTGVTLAPGMALAEEASLASTGQVETLSVTAAEDAGDMAAATEDASPVEVSGEVTADTGEVEVETEGAQPDVPDTPAAPTGDSSSAAASTTTGVAADTPVDEVTDSEVAVVSQDANEGDLSSDATSASPDVADETPVADVATVAAKPLAAKATATSATSVTAKAASDASGSTTQTTSELINVYRMYNPNSGEHFYTAHEGEALSLFGVGWRWEGVAYEASRSEGTAIYRLYNPNAGYHFYTKNEQESQDVKAAGWKLEGIAWYAVGNLPLYRLYNHNDGTHVYTTSATERDSVAKAGWRYEGVAWQVTGGKVALTNDPSHMVYSSAYGSRERYWIASDANIAKSRIVKASESGVGYDVYATSTGAIARNRHVAVAQVVYSANNEGRLSIATNLRGIDVASWQASMNTATVDADFVIVKATQGTSYINPYMKSQAAGTYDSGKLLGFYHYASTNYGGGDANAEAEYFVSQLGDYVGKSLLVLDWEGISNSNFGKNDVTYVKTFLDRVYLRTGVKGLVYMSRSVANSHNWSSVVNAGYGLWVAQYLYYSGTSQYPAYTDTPKTSRSSTTWSNGMTGAWSSPTIYQYTSEGHVSGYSGELDLNIYYGDSTSWTALASKSA